MRDKRRKFGAAFKAQVALAAVRGNKNRRRNSRFTRTRYRVGSSSFWTEQHWLSTRPMLQHGTVRLRMRRRRDTAVLVFRFQILMIFTHG